MSSDDRGQHGPQADHFPSRRGVHKPLLPITACSDMGYDCYLGKEGGSLQGRMTGEVIPLELRGSLYSLRMWVRKYLNSGSGFIGPV